jgi:hypothetical protein
MLQKTPRSFNHIRVAVFPVFTIAIWLLIVVSGVCLNQ